MVVIILSYGCDSHFCCITFRHLQLYWSFVEYLMKDLKVFQSIHWSVTTQEKTNHDTKTYPNNYDDFTLLQSNCHSRGSCVLRRLISGYNLEELHLIDWREVVHSNYLRTQRDYSAKLLLFNLEVNKGLQLQAS